MDSCSLDTPGLWNYLIRNHHFSLMEKYISCFTGTLCCFYYQLPFFYLSTLTFDKFFFDLLVYTFFPFGYNFFVLMLGGVLEKKQNIINFLGC